MKRREPASFQALVTPLFKGQRRESHLTLNAIKSRWAEIVGPDLAAKCQPTRVQRGVLWIAAADASWAYQFQFMRSEILQCVQTVLGPSDIHEVRFKAGLVAAPEPVLAPPLPPGAPEPALSDDDPLVRAAQAIPNPEIRALFTRSLAKQRTARAQRTGADSTPPKKSQP